MTLLLVAAVFTVMVAIPLLPGLLELRRKEDADPLVINQTYARDPRFFGTSLRGKLDPYLDGCTELPAVLEITMRRTERLEVVQEVSLGHRSETHGILAALGSATVGQGSTVGELYAREDADVAADSTVRAVAVDGSLRFGPRTRLTRWADARGRVVVAQGCNLGVSVTAGEELSIGPGCRFQRLWGLPVLATAPGPRVEPTRPTSVTTIDEVMVWADRRLAVPSGVVIATDVVVRGDLMLGAGAVVKGSVKATGRAVLGPGAVVEGDLVSRKDVELGTGSAVWGHVFAEGSLTLGPGCTVGRGEAFVSAYAAGSIHLRAGARVFGWVIAERGGHT